MQYKKFLLLESKNDGKPHVIGGILVSDAKDEDILCSVLLQQGYGCTYFLSKDGTSQNLLKIVAFQQKAPFQMDAVGPYVYQMEIIKVD